MAEEQKEAKGQKKDEKVKTVKKDDNIIYVGKKPTMSYVLAVITQFSDGVPEVNIKARGRSISRAVDVAEVVKNRFMQSVKYDIDIGTEEVQDEQKSRINVSTINIRLKK
ncbi:MAG: DNA-binding protein Alba [Candidatus Aenigmatarchaeota archaeon]|nr:MAG: DNA-binding protein Alba [Candidatus Aenigmarchaeota archaeon]